MTTPPPPPTDPLLDPARLALWAQQDPLESPAFADLVIEAVTTLLRHYGDMYWTTENIPPRARDIGYVVAKDYYLNPRQLRQETTGPLQESLDASVLNGINLTEEQKAELAYLATNVPGQVDGLYALGTTRGDIETHKGRHAGTVVIYDTRGEWPIEYLDGADVVVFVPETPEEIA